ncbi:MAG TPA: methyltransferase domain-containing protein [Chitinophagaceae bacterium]
MPFIASSAYLDNYFSDESHFCQLYPLDVQMMDKSHWSPLIVVYKACQFLADKDGARILDIGSGAGKFCLAGAYYKRKAVFTGVEQRSYLVDIAQAAREKLGRLEVSFIHGNFTRVNFNEYDHFYFYNSFFENLTMAPRIDDTIEHSLELYNYYNFFLRKKLEERPAGTKVVTFKSFGLEIPGNYELTDSQMNNDLKFWISR